MGRGATGICAERGWSIDRADALHSLPQSTSRRSLQILQPSVRPISPQHFRTSSDNERGPCDRYRRQSEAIFAMVLSLDDLRGPECEMCGNPIPEGKRSDALHCSRKCTTAHVNHLIKLATLEKKAKRSPCLVCGAAITAATNGNRRYCSVRCRGKMAYSKRVGRQNHPKPCEHCRTWFNAYYPHQRFCSVWCKANKEPSGFAATSVGPRSRHV